MSFGGSRIPGAQQRLGVPADSAVQCNIRSKGAHGFQHPVRLYMPKSKTEEYLNHMGKKVLASFPVQATIHFYNDDTDSEEEEEDEYSMDLHNYSHNAESFAGREMGGATEGSKGHSSSVTEQSSQ
ncbi:protein ripply3 isoform X2 [Hyperolius riggenbachi]